MQKKLIVKNDHGQNDFRHNLDVQLRKLFKCEEKTENTHQKNLGTHKHSQSLTHSVHNQDMYSFFE